ncbi:hypothetical protein ACFV7Q_27845 [Streptomyces sp. NPDC059851]|uniref:hypothetical protein n=1 Tax=Streptomyces sp. NPDC059851 TaxID=3346971 RepID=UPI003651EFD5
MDRSPYPSSAPEPGAEPGPPGGPAAREEFAAELTRLREKAGLTVRMLAARVESPGAHTPSR